MSVLEEAFVFECEGETLPGIISMPMGGACGDLGVVIVVGGPQYRVGSHRQFVLLARALAADGFPTLRFDYRGMGDASGAFSGFEDVESDIRSAVDAFGRKAPSMRRFVLWGLCDGATASGFYAPTDDRIVGLVLANPWVRTETGEAEAYLKHYYWKRFSSAAFWKKLLTGGVPVGRALRGFVEKLRSVWRARSRQSDAANGARSDALPDRLAHALRRAGKPCHIILSGRDYVAKEFESVIQSGGDWASVAAFATFDRLPAADHTFSSAAYRDQVAAMSSRWLNQLVQTGENFGKH